MIGGGIAGMEAASTAAECGHTVELFERQSSLGGEMIPSGACDSNGEIRKLQEWMLCRLEKQGISVHLNREISVEEIRSSGFDTIILATGAGSTVSDPIKGADKAIPAASAIKDISNIGKKVIVVGGSIMGLETAACLTQAGRKVTVLEALPKILDCNFISQAYKTVISDFIEHLNIEIITNSRVIEITDEGVILAPCDDSGEKDFIRADSVVMSFGSKQSKPHVPVDYGKDIAVYEVNSIQNSDDFYNPVCQAFEVAYHLGQEQSAPSAHIR